MKIIVNYWQGRRERQDFRFQLFTQNVEKRTLDMMGKEGWIPVNPGDTVRSEVTRKAVELLAQVYKDVHTRDEPSKAITKVASHLIPDGLVIDLGEV